MKKTISNCLIIAVLALAFMSCDKEIYNNDGKIQLLERIIYPDPDFRLNAKSLTQCQTENAVKYEKYEYDNQNRIAKILRYNRSGTVVGTQTFTYNGNDLVKVVHEGGPCGPDVETREFARNGNKITITINGGYLNFMGTRTFTFELTEDEFPTNFRSLDDWPWSHGETHNQYQDGNLIKRIGSGSQDYSITFEYDENKSPFYNSQTPRWYMFYINYNGFGGNKNNLIREIGVGVSSMEYKYEYDKNGFPTKRTTDSDRREYTIEFRYKFVSDNIQLKHNKE